MRNKTKGRILHISSLVIDVAPPLIATLTQFPVWIEHSSEATISGIVLLLGFICCLPFINQIKEYMKSPAVVVIWAIVYVAFMLLRSIIDQMLIVAFIGLISNIIGTGLYKWGDIYSDKKDEETKEEA